MTVDGEHDERDLATAAAGNPPFEIRGDPRERRGTRRRIAAEDVGARQVERRHRSPVEEPLEVADRDGVRIDPVRRAREYLAVLDDGRARPRIGRPPSDGKRWQPGGRGDFPEGKTPSLECGYRGARDGPDLETDPAEIPGRCPRRSERGNSE